MYNYYTKNTDNFKWKFLSKKSRNFFYSNFIFFTNFWIWAIKLVIINQIFNTFIVYEKQLLSWFTKTNKNFFFKFGFSSIEVAFILGRKLILFSEDFDKLWLTKKNLLVFKESLHFLGLICGKKIFLFSTLQMKATVMWTMFDVLIQSYVVAVSKQIYKQIYNI